MTHKQRMALAILKGRTDGNVTVAKACVRAACIIRDTAESDTDKSFASGNLRQAINCLRSVRDIQRHLSAFCKEVESD